MTVVACFIMGSCTVHASDSLLTSGRPGALSELGWEDGKLVPVTQFRGAFGYYGFAGMSDGASTKRWLHLRASEAHRFPSADAFAAYVAQQATAWIAGVQSTATGPLGLGIHFTVYEWFDGYWVPELFHIRNWGTTIGSVERSFRWSRDTYATLGGQLTEASGARPELRAEVRRFLTEADGFFRFNNGDPQVFNPLADAIQSTGFGILSRRVGGAASAGPQEWLSLARRPVEVACDLHRDLLGVGTRTVGGRAHDLLVRPDGVYASTSGDAP